ncbi:MAG: hypothetical protein AAB353_04725 [Candidatus Hydrogenedentota bacterium]
MTRRQWIASATASAAGLTTGGEAHARDTGRAWAVEEEDYRDPVTKARVRVLTPDQAKSQVIYQTDPKWVNDMRYLVFTSELDGAMVPHARQMQTGIVRPIVDGPVGAMYVHRTKDELYFLRDRSLYRQYITSAFQQMIPPARLASLPEEAEEVVGGIGFDADDETIYVGVKFGGVDEWGIICLDPKTMRWETIGRVTFQIGHVQPHPTITGRVMFCQESGGDTEQRMWCMQRGDFGPKPYYLEHYGEWVTHEAWWGATRNLFGSFRCLFTIWPYDEEHLKEPHGIASVDIYGGDFRLHCQYPAWHVHGSPDLQLIVGDDFDRNLWLIRPLYGDRRLLTYGHLSEGFRTHPHASFTPDSKAVVFNSGRLGKEDVMLVEVPEFESLPSPEEAAAIRKQRML